MIILLNTSANSLAQGCKQLKPHYESGTYRRTDRRLACKLETIVMNDPPGDTKLMNDMVCNKVNQSSSVNFDERCSFRLL